MSNKYFDGVVTNTGAAEEVDEDLKAVVLGTADKVSAKMDQLRVADAMTEIFALFKRCNKYIDETMPWALAKDEAKKDRLATVLYNLVEGISIGASLLESFMPETAAKVVAQLNTTLRSLEDTKTFGLYPSGNKVVEKPEILFARLDVNKVLEKVAEKKAAEEAANHVPTVEIEPYAAEDIDFDTFCKSDFRAVKVKECSAVKKSKKLLHFILDDGTGTDRVILSGIHAFYEPEELVGKTLLAITNLPPRKMMGIESCGMLMSAIHTVGGEEKLNLVMLDDAIPAGAKLY
jgi:methionyl-tRNA synthetase